MVLLFFKSASPRLRWRNIYEIALRFLSVLACLLIAVQSRVSSEDQALLTIFDDLYDELSTKKTTPYEVTDSESRAGGETTNDNTPAVNPGETPPTIRAPSEGVTGSFPAPYPPPNQNGNENLGNDANNNHQRRYYHRYDNRPRNYRYRQNYENRPLNYGRNNFANNGTDTRYQQPRQQYQRRGYHPYYRYDNDANAEANANGNYTPTYYNDYYHHEYTPPGQQYYEGPPDQQQYYNGPPHHQHHYDDPPHNEHPQYNTPPFAEQHYVYPPAEQYYGYAQPPAPADPNYGFAADYPQYGEKQQYYQPQYDQPYYATSPDPHQYTQEESPSSAALEMSDTTSQGKSGRRRDRTNKKTKSTTPSSSETPSQASHSPPRWDSQHYVGHPAQPGQWNPNDAPSPLPPNAPQLQAWNPHAHPVSGPQLQGNWYPQNYPIYPYDPNWYPALYQQNQPQQQQQNIDWQVLHLNFEDEVSANWLQSVNPQTQERRRSTKKPKLKQETTEKNYNTFAAEELRDRTRTTSEDVNYNTYSDLELKELQGVNESHSVEEEYVEYDTRELEESDSNETRDYNTRDPFNATKPTEEINYNLYGPEELRAARRTTEDRNYNTYGNRPDYHTDPHSSKEYYVERPSTRNASGLPSYHPPQARNSKYFASAKPPIFEMPTMPFSEYREQNQQKGYGQLSESLDNVMSPNMSASDTSHKTKISESFLNRWLFGGRHSGITEPRSTFDHSLFFASPATKDHWLLSSHKLKRNRTSTRPTSSIAFDDESYESIPWLPPLYNRQSSSTNGTVEYAPTTRPSPVSPSSSVNGDRTRPHHHKHPHDHHSHHHQTKVEQTSPMPSYKPREFTLTYSAKHTHHHHHHHHQHTPQHSHHHHKTFPRSSKVRSKHHRGRYARDVSSDTEEVFSEDGPNPLDVSNAKDYCAWANQQRYLQSMERRAKEDRQHQKISRRPMFSEIGAFRSVNPEYMRTPYWTGSTSYVWLPGGRKKKVIDLPDESYGLLIEDEEEWWQAQRREAKTMRANKFLGLNAEGARKSRQQAQADAKKSKVRRFFGFVKNVFRKITGVKKKEAEDEATSENDDKNRDGHDQRKDDETAEGDGDRRNWGRGDRRFHRWRGNYQQRNYNNPNYRNYPDQGYQNYRNPGDANYNNNPQNLNHDDRNPNNNPQQGSNPNNADQQNNRNENRRFNYKPFHHNYKHPDSNYNQNYRQDQNVQGTVVTPHYTPQNNENSNTRSMDPTSQ